SHTTSLQPLSLHDALPIFKELSFQDKIFRCLGYRFPNLVKNRVVIWDSRSAFDKKDRTCIIEDNIPNAQLIFPDGWLFRTAYLRSEEHTSELQSRERLVCR